MLLYVELDHVVGTTAERNFFGSICTFFETMVPKMLAKFLFSISIFYFYSRPSFNKSAGESIHRRKGHVQVDLIIPVTTLHHKIATEKRL